MLLLRPRSDGDDDDVCDDDNVCGKKLSVGGDCVGVDSSAPGAQLARCLHPRLVYSVQCTVYSVHCTVVYHVQVPNTGRGSRHNTWLQVTGVRPVHTNPVHSPVIHTQEVQ